MRKMMTCPRCNGKMWPNRAKLCRKCYLTNQGPNGDIISETQRFFSKTKKDGDCVVWSGHLNNKGYGTFNVKRGGFWIKILAHRYSYEMVNGLIPNGLEIDHLCRNSACVNPKHLEAVTHSINAKRGELPNISKTRSLAQTYCKHGHPYDEKNTYRDKRGYRNCKICARERNKKYRLKKMEAKNG